MDKNLSKTLTAIRRVLVILLLLGLLGTGTELLLLDHFEDSWQLIPLILIAMGLAVLCWHFINRGRASIRALQVTMILFLLAGLAGFVFHYQGNKAFQLEANPALDGWELFSKVIKAKAPPALAPGAMIHLGLLGLAYAYRHPALAGPENTQQTGA